MSSELTREQVERMESAMLLDGLSYQQRKYVEQFLAHDQDMRIQAKVDALCVKAQADELFKLRTSLEERDEAYGYLSRLFLSCAPQCEVLPTLPGLATQLDNYIAGLHKALAEQTTRAKNYEGLLTCAEEAIGHYQAESADLTAQRAAGVRECIDELRQGIMCSACIRVVDWCEQRAKELEGVVMENPNGK